MAHRPQITVDGNTAVASVAYRLSEVIAIYPITPSSSMGELADEWAAAKSPNLWGTIPIVTEMQSEGGAAGAVHGAVQGGALATTFTASQGLLLMIPNMYKIAGELTPLAMHVSARTLATHALSIFGDHSDVMACRQTGFALIASGSVQEAQDLACVAHAATLQTRVPFLHFFDGFRTSHEVAKIEELGDDVLRAMTDEARIAEHRRRALSPDHPVVRGTAHNPDTYFQAREAVNPWYDRCAGLVVETMDRFGELTGRRYRPFDYVGHREPDRVIVMMGSGAEAAHEAVDWMVAKGERVGLVKVRLYRPFSALHLLATLPRCARRVAVLDRTKEPGAIGDPLYLDVVTALHEARQEGRLSAADVPHVTGGRYGLSSKEFTPAMVKAVFDDLGAPKPRAHYTVGIVDDVTHTSLPVDPELDIEPSDVVRAVLYGLGSDGTVGASKNTIKIIGEETPQFAQGYFVYDSKKSGAITISHLRFGPREIRSTYLIKKAGLVGVHHWTFFDRYDVLEHAADGGILLVNAPMPADQVWAALPREAQDGIIAKRLRVHAINADRVAREAGMAGRTNTVMQACFFALSGVLPREEAIKAIKDAVDHTYRRKGAAVVQKNFAAIDASLAQLHEVPAAREATVTRRRPPVVSSEAPEFVQRVTAAIMAGLGDSLPVSAFPPDGTWPTGSARWEKRNLAPEIPVWDAAICIQCNKCTLVCPHAAIRAKVYAPAALAGAPPGFKSMDWKGKELEGEKYTIQVAPEDCTGCSLCVVVCPAKDKGNPRHKAIDMMAQPPLRETERASWDFFAALPEADRRRVTLDVKGSQLLEPLFEASGACAGCGETPYIKLATQLFGDRMYVANATGCSSIYGANLPTTPYSANRDGRGPAWSNSLFEDNAEFGYGMRLAVDAQNRDARLMLGALGGHLGDVFVDALLGADQSTEAGILEQRARVVELRARLSALADPRARRLELLADTLVKKSVWIVGGDGWAYDIGYGGLDHVLASGADVNLLVLDTEVYSNTGGQQSKATPIGAAAKFAVAGKAVPKKDLGLLAMGYGNVFVARVAMGAKDAQCVKAFVEADAFRGPSLIIAYSHCIAHGYDMSQGAEQQKRAVATGYWPLYRFDPRRLAQGERPLKLDSAAPQGKLGDFMHNETRFRMVEEKDPDRYAILLRMAELENLRRFELYQTLAAPAASKKKEA
jgi:pyruvate-ferredoxin/flavodoxin oxidoreductase